MNRDSPGKPGATGVTRRRALWAFLATGTAALTGALGAILGRFLVGPLKARAAAQRLAAGPLDRYAGSPDPVEATLTYRDDEGYYSEIRRQRVYLFSENGRLVALSSTCSHLGCGVSWDPGKRLFLCPCHGGAYHRDGTVAGGPPPRPLRRLPIEIVQGTVYVNLGETA